MIFARVGADVKPERHESELFGRTSESFPNDFETHSECLYATPCYNRGLHRRQMDVTGGCPY